MAITENSVSVSVRNDEQGHWVEWMKDGVRLSLGPYQSAQMAEDVRSAKEREFAENASHIGDH